jgi:hypothetical protein
MGFAVTQTGPSVKMKNVIPLPLEHSTAHGTPLLGLILVLAESLH